MLKKCAHMQEGTGPNEWWQPGSPFVVPGLQKGCQGCVPIDTFLNINSIYNVSVVPRWKRVIKAQVLKKEKNQNRPNGVGPSQILWIFEPSAGPKTRHYLQLCHLYSFIIDVCIHLYIHLYYYVLYLFYYLLWVLRV